MKRSPIWFGGENFHEFDFLLGDMITEPMVFDGVVFGAWGHATRFKASKSDGTNIMIVNFDVHLTSFVR